MVRIAALLCVFSVGAALRRHSKSEGATGREGMLGSDTSSYAVNKEAPNIAVNKEAPQAAAATYSLQEDKGRIHYDRPMLSRKYSLQEEGKTCKNRNHAFYSLVHDLGACAEFVEQKSGCGVWMIYYPAGWCYCVPEYNGNYCDFATSVEGAKVYMFEAPPPMPTYSLQEEGKSCKNQNYVFFTTVHDLGACAEFVHQRIGCGVWWIYYPTGRCHCVPEYAGNCDFATSDQGANVYMFEARSNKYDRNQAEPVLAVQAEPAVGKEAPQVAVNKEAPNIARE